MGLGLKSGLSVFVESLHKFSPKLHDSLFGASMTAHPKIDKLRNTFVGRCIL